MASAYDQDQLSRYINKQSQDVTAWTGNPAFYQQRLLDDSNRLFKDSEGNQGSVQLMSWTSKTSGLVTNMS